MLTIRTEQMQALRKVQQKRFLEGLIEHVQDVFPERFAEWSGGITDPASARDAARSVIEDELTKAEPWGLKTERALTLYLDLVARLGRDFAKLPEYRWILRILRDTSLEGNQRLDLIYSQLQNLEASS